jgi:hypothetical protein
MMVRVCLLISSRECQPQCSHSLNSLCVRTFNHFNFANVAAKAFVDSVCTGRHPDLRHAGARARFDQVPHVCDLEFVEPSVVGVSCIVCLLPLSHRLTVCSVYSFSRDGPGHIVPLHMAHGSEILVYVNLLKYCCCCCVMLRTSIFLNRNHAAESTSFWQLQTTSTTRLSASK